MSDLSTIHNQLAVEIKRNTNEEYHADLSAVSSSRLKKILRSPAHFMFGEEKDETDALAFGTAFHMAVLEPHLFEQSYFVYDEIWSGGAYDAARLANPGKLPLKSKKMKDILGMAAAVRAYKNGKYVKILGNSVMEHSLYFTDPRTGIRCKIRPDFMHRDFGGFDLKSCLDCRPDAFLRGAIDDYSYDLSSVMYMDGLRAYIGKDLPFTLIAVEKVAPYGIWEYEVVRNLEHPFYRNGYLKYRRALETLKICRDKDVWPGYKDSCSPAGFAIPKWLVEKEPALS